MHCTASAPILLHPGCLLCCGVRAVPNRRPPLRVTRRPMARQPVSDQQCPLGSREALVGRQLYCYMEVIRIIAVCFAHGKHLDNQRRCPFNSWPPTTCRGDGVGDCIIHCESYLLTCKPCQPEVILSQSTHKGLSTSAFQVIRATIRFLAPTGILTNPIECSLTQTLSTHK